MFGGFFGLSAAEVFIDNDVNSGLSRVRLACDAADAFEFIDCETESFRSC
jgi:hypothetical protein